MSEQQHDMAPTGARMSEHVLRQLLSWGFAQIRKNLDSPRDVISELFRIQGAERRKEIRAYLRDATGIAFEVNYPRQDLALPWVCVVEGSVQEDPNFTFLGDHVGIQRLGVLGGIHSTRQQKGVGLQCNTQIYVAAQDQQLVSYLSYLAYYILFSNKDALHEQYDIYNLKMSWSDLQWRQELFPSFCYMKVITCQYGSFFDFNEHEEARAIVSLDLSVATEFTAYPAIPAQAEDVGEATIVSVPSE
jgi:hypothetical protein